MSMRHREQAVTVNVYPQLDIEPVSAQGPWLTLKNGDRMLDLYGGHAVAALGYGHPALSAALNDQAQRMIFQSNAVALDERAAAAEALLAFGPDNLRRVFFCNSGGEANENALRIACMLTGRKKVVAMEHGFHGRTAAAAAVTWGSDRRWYGFPQRPFDVEFVTRDDVAAARATIDAQTAAVIIEPVQGVAGAYDFSTAFMQELRSLCDSTGALLIADEVQTGVARSGAPFAMQRHGVTADLLSAAKSLGGGFPCAALCVTESIAESLKPGDLGSTFGGGPLAARAILAVLATIEEERLLDNVLAREQQLRALTACKLVERVSGLGFLCGLHVTTEAKAVRDALLAQNVLTGTSADPHVIRLLPPLNLSGEHVDLLAEALERIA